MRVAVLSRWGSFKSDESIARAVHTTASPDHLPLRIELEAMGALVRARNTRSSTRTRGAPLEGERPIFVRQLTPIGWPSG